MANTHTTVVVINVVVTLVRTRRRFSLRPCLFDAFVFSSTTRTPSLHISLSGATSTSGVPSVRQNINMSSA
jgi:hypothetical protein